MHQAAKAIVAADLLWRPLNSHLRHHSPINTSTTSDMRALLLLGFSSIISAASAQAQQPAASPCLIVFSKGQNMSDSNPKVNEMWNQINDAFGQFVSEELTKAGKKVIEMPHPVEANDMATNGDRILKKARQEGCEMIVSTSMYADQQKRQFVSAFWINAIAITKSSNPAGTYYTIGKEIFRKEKLDPLSEETFGRLVPSTVAKSLVDAYLSGSK